MEEATNEPCPHRINKTACQWTLSGYPHYRQAARWINLVLRSSNKFGNHTQVFKINNFAIIRPPPPERLYEKDVSATSVELAWEIDPTLDLGPADDKSEHPILEYQIVKEDMTNGGIEVDEVNDAAKSFIHRNLIPATVYRFGVRCRTIQSKSDEFWSELSSITIATKPDRKYYLDPINFLIINFQAPIDILFSSTSHSTPFQLVMNIERSHYIGHV